MWDPIRCKKVASCVLIGCRPASDFHGLVKINFHRAVERALVTCGFDIKYGKSTWIHTLFHAVEMPVDWLGKLSQWFGMYP